MTKEELRYALMMQQLHVDDSTMEKLEALISYTLEANEKFNLTAITNEEEFRELMIYDSLLPMKYVDFTNKKVLDLGTGGGFPGLPLLLCNNMKLTFLDSTAKKINHTEKYLLANNLEAKTVATRAEDYAKKNREKFDIVISRAVSKLNILLELAIPYLKVGGLLLAMKGKNYQAEIEEAKSAFNKLDAEIVDLHLDNLTGNEERCLIVIKKNKVTKKKYPRSYSEIKSNPL